MKVVTITKYECEKCGHQHITEAAARECEALPVRYDRGVKVGDIVLITAGDGRGQRAEVTAVHVHSPGWGPRAYDHTVYLVAKVVDSWGSRQLSFDSYEAREP